MTPQEIFNKVATHLMTAPKRAYVKNQHNQLGGYCVYHAPDGGACAVGCLISDRYYRKAMDDGPMGLNGLLKEFKLPRWMHKHQQLLHDLQDVHDDPNHWTKRGPAHRYKMKLALQNVADGHELNHSVLGRL